MKGIRGATEVSQKAQPTGVLRMRGLPFTVSKRDILNFLAEARQANDEAVREECVFTGSDMNGRKTGEAFVYSVVK